MKILIYSLVINNLLIIYFYSFFQTASKIFTKAVKHLPDWKVYDAKAFAKKHPSL